MHDSAFLEQPLHDFQRGSKTNVVGIGLEREPQNRHVLSFDHPERLMNFFEKAIDALFVDALSGFEQIEIDADCGTRDE